ncbi:MAG: carboxypeptidase-like regulatory domain-containing protein, partial [Polaribacter sp.]|nr:carboxypeptidase-like regulatory domain-containing protein [Polaribacter sp.]
MKKIILLSLSLVSFSIFSQIEKNVTSAKNPRSISGFVLDNQYPLSGVNILIKNSTRGTTTNKKGFFTIKAATHEIIQFSHLGYRPLKILVEDLSKKLKVQLRAESTILEEVTIKTKLHTVKPKSFYRIGRGLVNVRNSSYIKGTELNPASISLGMALRGKIAGLKIKKNIYGEDVAFLRGFNINSASHAIWDVDGVIFQSAPPISISQIKSVVVLKSIAKTILYGSEGSGGVIVVTTTTGDEYYDLLRNVDSKENPHTNKNYYDRDAILFKDIKSASPKYHTELEAAISIGNAFKIYKTLEVRFNMNSNFYMDMVSYFDEKYKNKNYTRLIL